MNDLTTRDYWETTSVKPPRMRLPLSLNVAVLNQKKILRSYIKQDMKVLEIGCAPAKMLAYCAARLSAQVAGIDYSAPGMAHAAQLFQALGIKGDLRCENMFSNSFPHQSFDVVYSFGVVEHFLDPSSAIDAHIQLTKPGGVALIVIPNYGGIYGYLQDRFDPDNLRIHNLDIMTPEKYVQIVSGHQYQVRSYLTGNLSASLVSFHNKFPPFLARIVTLLTNAVGLIQPFKIASVCPMLVLEVNVCRSNVQPLSYKYKEKFQN